MPTYEYRCEACGHELELFQNISEAPKKKCPACKRSKLKRKIGGGAGFLFKGSGFYLTDYRSDSYKKGAESESKGAEPKGGDGASTDGTKDAKPGDKGDKKAAPTKPAAAHERAAEKKKKKHG